MYAITIIHKNKTINVYRSTRAQVLRAMEELAYVHFPEDVATVAGIIAYSSNKLTVTRKLVIKL